MITLITGGSGSGKSAYAEDLMLSLGAGKRIYIATMFPFDEESQKRIERHRRMRQDKQFETIECCHHLKDLEITKDALVLLECISNLVANEMYMEAGAGGDTVMAVLDGIAHLAAAAKKLCVVTNEVFSDGIQYDSETRRYLKYLGEINQMLAKQATTVIEVVYGLPIVIKEMQDETNME